MSAQKMFWGLIVRPEKRYESIIEEAFHVSKACIEPQSAGKGATSVYVEADGEEFLVCNLSSNETNVTLDLNFNEGEKICFKTAGEGTVHLTGYNVDQDMDMDSSAFGMDSDSDSEAEEEEEEEDDVPDLVKPNSKKQVSALDKLVADKKKKGDVKKGPSNESELEAAVKTAKEFQAKVAKNSKKIPAGAHVEEESSDEDDMDDDDDEDEDEVDEEEEDDDEDDDDEDDEEEEMESDEKVSPTKGLTNGAAKQTPKKNEKEANKSPGKNKENKTPNKDKAVKQEKASPKKVEGTPKPGKTPKKTLKGGIIVEEISVGSGPEVKRGKMVGVYYDGKLKSNNKRFDATMSGKPFKFRLGHGEVIKGWDIGMEGMKVGGKRRLTIPSGMAYGDKGDAPVIPPKATLVFDVECKFVN